MQNSQRPPHHRPANCRVGSTENALSNHRKKYKTPNQTMRESTTEIVEMTCQVLTIMTAKGLKARTENRELTINWSYSTYTARECFNQLCINCSACSDFFREEE